MDYVTWIIYAFPMFILRLPIVTATLIITFKPGTTDMSRAIARLRTQVTDGGSYAGFGMAHDRDLRLTILGWMTLSKPPPPGLGVIAIVGVPLSSILGLVAMGSVHQFRSQLGGRAALCRRHLARRRDEGDVWPKSW